MFYDYLIDFQKMFLNYFLNIFLNSFNIFEVLKVIFFNCFIQIWCIQYIYMMMLDVFMLINLDLVIFFKYYYNFCFIVMFRNYNGCGDKLYWVFEQEDKGLVLCCYE